MVTEPRIMKRLEGNELKVRRNRAWISYVNNEIL